MGLGKTHTCKHQARPGRVSLRGYRNTTGGARCREVRMSSAQQGWEDADGPREAPQTPTRHLPGFTVGCLGLNLARCHPADTSLPSSAASSWILQIAPPPSARIQDARWKTRPKYSGQCSLSSKLHSARCTTVRRQVARARRRRQPLTAGPGALAAPCAPFPSPHSAPEYGSRVRFQAVRAPSQQKPSHRQRPSCVTLDSSHGH